jgi:hypothetical protein
MLALFGHLSSGIDVLEKVREVGGKSDIYCYEICLRCKGENLLFTR